MSKFFSQLFFACAMLSAVACAGCSRDSSSTELTVSFDSIPQGKPLTGTVINEASGLADSRRNPGQLWVNEDSGNPPVLFLVSHQGAVTDSIYLKGAVNRDWEEIALAKGPDASLFYLYVGDIGDNDGKFSECTIYRFPEPASNADTVKEFDQIRYRYDDGPRDAEAFFVDEPSRDIIIITKREAKARIYRIRYPQSLTEVNEAKFEGELGINGVVAATTNSREIVLKTYTALYHYSRKAGQPLSEVFSKAPKTLYYKVEPQGEAVALANDNSGFFTLSEKGFGNQVILYFYRRK